MHTENLYLIINKEHLKERNNPFIAHSKKTITKIQEIFIINIFQIFNRLV